MAQTGYTPIQLYYSSTTTNAPTAGNLASGELAINITDGKLFYKDNGGVVQVIAWKTTPTTAGGTGLTSWTAGDLPYYATGTTLSKLGIGTNGQILTSTGTAPQWSTLSGVAVTTFSAGTTGFTPSSATSGAVTLAGTLATTNGGTGLTSFTANGVVYASSTSALTTGSALTFDGTNLGIGTGSPVTKLDVRATSFTPTSSASSVLIEDKSTWAQGLQFYLNNSGTFFSSRPSGALGASNTAGLILSAGSFVTNDPDAANGFTATHTSASIYRPLGGAHIWYANTGLTAGSTFTASEQMRLTTTGLGIGTSSPAAKLHVIGDQIRHSNSSNASFYGTFYHDAASTGANIYNSQDNGGHLFQNSGSTVLTLSNSGNLGLGVTPSAWESARKAIQLSGTASYFAANSVAVIAANNFFDGQNKYIGTGYATQYAQSAGQHIWLTAPSWNGTGSDVISFTQAMTLDASGNLGIGTSSPVGKLDVSGSNAGSVLTSRILNTSTSASSDAQNFIYVNGATAGDAYTTWTVGGVTSWSGGVRNSDSDNWYLSPGSSLATSPTLVATTSGDVGIGTNSPSSSLVVQRASAVSSFGIRHTASGNGYGYRFATSGTTTNDLTISSEFNGSLTTRATITAAGFMQPVAYADTVVAIGNTGTAATINLQSGNVFTATLTGNCTFTLSNPIATGSSSFTLILTNDGTAGRTVAWAGGSFVFPGGAAALSRTTTANAVDVWVFFTPNGGTTWYGNIAMKDMKA